MPQWIHARNRAIGQISMSTARLGGTQGSMNKLMNKLLMLVGLVVLTASVPLYVLAQTRSEEKILVGQVQSVDESGTELTLADGTKLLTPLGAQFNPGVLEKGMIVVAMYREQDDGRKVLTRLSRGQSEPVPEAPKRSE
jgi:Protein of unknown function (DUF1344)